MYIFMCFAIVPTLKLPWYARLPEQGFSYTMVFLNLLIACPLLLVLVEN